jgi:murein DD-endopeptidase MepM/ murein hydrolase activator NlpD
MAKILDYIEALNAGYTPQEIMDFIRSNPDVELINQPAQTTIPKEEQPTGGEPPNIVSPFYNDKFVQTQAFGENPQIYGDGGHQGEDYGYTGESDTRQLRAPIGGMALTGYQPGGYGNVTAIVGANPREYAQMSDEDKKKVVQQFEKYLNSARSLKDFPELARFKNVVLMGHGEAPSPYKSGDPIATGSAVFNEGATGWATGPHVHIESTQEGQEIPFSNLMEKIKSMQYR